MVRTQIQLTTEQSDTLKRLSEAQGVSMAELIRQSIDLYIAKRHEPTLAEKRRRALTAVGAFTDEATDLSENHDTYFAEAAQQ
ncbi:MAG: ribbon-helix-helix domain-containing protein [Ardenticatenaceae bacterium]|nr:ribbon-helix-helix domain-containing protein [Ardenticatenaceae bacterium]